jgi:hypothetical protein
MMREFLVTKFVCSKCGSNLHLTHDVPIGAGKYANGEPTGAAMVQQLIAVEPCAACMRPLEEMCDAARTLIAINEIYKKKE